MRTIQQIFKTIPTIEGAGVRLKRGFAGNLAELFDPFLLFDDFSNEEAEAYEAGFPTHPHRGIETVTYMRKGEVHHKDSMGNEGSIGGGDVQWMTAGSGIVHEEMPVVHDGGLQGFQLWVNIPQKHKMMAPRYQEIKKAEVPLVEEESRKVRVIAGTYAGVVGPVQDLMVSPTYLDSELEANIPFSLSVSKGDTFFIYVYEGSVVFEHDQHQSWVNDGEIALLTAGDLISFMSGKEGAKVLVIGGTPLNEPIAWAGPIVMNTKEEIETAFRELQNGEFIK